MRIAILEDEPQMAELLKVYLDDNGYDCFIYSTGTELLHAINRESFDLLIVDWLLPDIDGVDIVRHIRNQHDWPIPILFCTQMDSEDDIVQGLEAGADDYMTKPVHQKELLARIKALLRRSLYIKERDNIIEAPPFHIDCNSRQLTCEGVSVELTQKEFDLVVFLFRNIGRITSRGHILETVWGISDQLNTRTIDTHVSRIRHKLGLKPENGWRLNAVYQHGYRLEQVESDNNQHLKH